ncbi:N-6 DNA methylase [Planktothrix agardhii]|uniref:N-6 DNA methylase n=2 Tax=Planktothrix agardhii TaxID=1160 RepID=UPI0020A7F560|nr:N-6 DNA methylase [Planktothrix agardhii]CAD5948716.1 Type I restriction enzyme EcoEI M protein [Planktothrix agardhii]
MLDTDTKRRIDTARDILVGKVPDPKSQVEQITIALIYKFMDDMDAESEELGGDRQFFTGKFAAYGWSRLMSPSVGGHELIRLYEKGISTMPENQGIPALFRDIFKNAYLPYRDPETLKSFLKIINEFSYDHSEKLGDAFEYLLSVLGSQGDAGQFRTPRHIIDFIVEIIQPKKGEVILDPACGTAGFLISAYKHILRNNRDTNNISTLTPDEKGGLAKNFLGYDISPDMVRLSLVNLYLHGFNDPHIIEYDTLTSEDRWNQFADVILANPPFMSPKGGIKPHKRFSIKAKRSEVLFVDYIAEHLTPKGRAGIIVPEGIIFKSQTAYKDLRRMLLNNALVAVISLPAGVFNPYSEVKTSILILDKSLAKLSNTVAFFKVENDGFGLGAQRREVTGEQLTQVKIELELYLQAVRNQELTDNLELTLGLVVPKVKIAANGDYNFSGERYREGIVTNSKCPFVRFDEAPFEIIDGDRGINYPKKEEFSSDGYCVFLNTKNVRSDGFNFEEVEFITQEKDESLRKGKLCRGDVVLTTRGTIGNTGYYDNSVTFDHIRINSGMLIFRPDKNKLSGDYLFHFFQSQNFKNQRDSIVSGAAQPQLPIRSLVNATLPLPPIAIQQEIVTEIEGYQKVINGARAVIDNYRPHIPINPDWAMVKLGDFVTFTQGTQVPIDEQQKEFSEDYIRFIRIIDYTQGKDEIRYIKGSKNIPIASKKDLIMVRYGASAGFIGRGIEGVFANNLFRINLDKNIMINSDFLFYFFKGDKFQEFIKNNVMQAAMPALSHSIMKEVTIPLPPLEIQKAIVAEIEAEQTLVNANRELITRFEKKIQTTLNRIWGEE